MDFTSLPLVDKLKVIVHHIPTEEHIEVQKMVAAALITAYSKVNPLVNTDLKVHPSREGDIANEIEKIIRP